MVSPAPPSNSTLSGSTTAARPCCLRIVKMCWRKLSCLLLVVAQKSSRLMMSDSLRRLARLVDDGDAALLAEGRIGQDDVVFAVLAGQRVLGDDRQVVFRLAADAVQQAGSSRRAA